MATFTDYVRVVGEQCLDLVSLIHAHFLLVPVEVVEVGETLKFVGILALRMSIAIVRYPRFCKGNVNRYIRLDMVRKDFS